MLAGPNGSGKSSLVPQLFEAVNLGVIINADEIEAALKTQTGSVRLLNLYDWKLKLNAADLHKFCSQPGSQRLPLNEQRKLIISENTLLFEQVEITSYLAAWVAEFIRYYLLRSQQTMTFETVMSHPSKVEFLREARAAGYRTYLYFVATRGPEINITRVKARVAKGGHPVADDKVVERYYRSIALLRQALVHTDRTFIFDNSGEKPQLIAEITSGKSVLYHAELVPEWISGILR